VTISLAVLITEVARGKSIARILTNRALSEWAEEIHGVVLDLACGAISSYWRVLGLEGRGCVIGVDLDQSVRPTVVADLTQSIPLGSESCDAAILSSYLYIPAEPERALSEVWRVLKKGGHLILSAPLVFPYTPEPTDHWRFTEQALRLVLSRCGFVIEQLIPVGGRWTAAAYLIGPFLRRPWLAACIVYWLALKLDFWTQRWSRRLAACPIGYVVKARKS
jgi:SAM-dependent methyltransferase